MTLGALIGYSKFSAFFLHLFTLIHCTKAENFIMLSISDVGHQELRVSYRDRYLMVVSSPNGQSENGLALVQVTNGIRFVEIALRHGLVEDCLVTSSSKSVRRFMRDFRRRKKQSLSTHSLQTIADCYSGKRNISSLSLLSQQDSIARSQNSETFSNKDTSSSTLSPSLPSSFSSKFSASVSSSTLNSFRGKLYHKIKSLRGLDTVDPLLRQYLRIGKQVNICRRFYQTVVEHLGIPVTAFPSNRSLVDPFHHPGGHFSSPPKICCSDQESHVTFIHDYQKSPPYNSGSTDCKPCIIFQNLTSTVPYGELNGSSTYPAGTSYLQRSGPISSTEKPDGPPSRISGMESNQSSSQLKKIQERKVSKNRFYSKSSSESKDLDTPGNRPSSQVDHKEAVQTTLSRAKRDLLTGWMIFPGTKWCGDGDIAENKHDLGYHAELDKCCRRHDLCQVIIPRLTWKYGIFNYRLHTLCHCRCDRKFRKCLQRAGSPIAYLIGRIYFDVIGPQCFKFKQETACAERYWWGSCKKWESMKVAVPRRQRRFKLMERRRRRRRKYKGHDNRIL